MGADRRDFLQMCPPISADRVINMVVTGSSQHIVFLLHQKKKERRKRRKKMFLPLITSCEKLIFLFILSQIYGNLASSLGINMELACLYVLTEELNNEGSNKHPDQRNESERLGHNSRQKKVSLLL